MLRKLLSGALSGVIALALMIGDARAATYFDSDGQEVLPYVIVDPTGKTGALFTSSNPGHVAGSFSATLSGFAPASAGTPISATTSGATGTLPAGVTVIAENVGSYPAYCQLGSSTSGITSSKQISASGGQWAIVPGSATQITCEGVGGTTTINLLGGSGLGVDTGGGSSGGGGGTVAQGTAGSAGGAWFFAPTQGGSVLSATNGGYTNLLQTNAALSATNGLYANLLIGNAANASGNPLFAQLTAGTAIAGKFGVDQTTPGTTNGVSLAEIGATTVATGAGATGTGTQRVGVAQDTTTIAGSAPGTAGSPSANVVTVQGPSSGGSPIPVSGVVTANGFAPSSNYANIASVTTTSSNVALPSGSPTTIQVYNTGQYPIAVKLGTSNAVSVTATTGDVIQPGANAPYSVGSNTYLAAINTAASGASSLTISGGSGLGTQGAPGTNTIANVNANGAAAASASSPVTPANQPVGAAAFAATQVSCASTATSIVSARTGVSGTGRIAETITNTTTTAIYIGGSGVTTSTGQFLPGIAGASLTINTTAALYCIVASGTATVTSLETY